MSDAVRCVADDFRHVERFPTRSGRVRHKSDAFRRVADAVRRIADDFRHKSDDVSDYPIFSDLSEVMSDADDPYGPPYWRRRTRKHAKVGAVSTGVGLCGFSAAGCPVFVPHAAQLYREARCVSTIALGPEIIKL